MEQNPLCIAFASQKGGVGKSTLTVLAASWLHYLHGIRVVKSFVREDFEKERFAQANGDLKSTTMRALSVVIMMMPAMMLVMNFTILAVIWFGGQQVIGGTMAVGDLTAFINYVTQILMSLMMLTMVFMNSSRTVASAAASPRCSTKRST